MFCRFGSQTALFARLESGFGTCHGTPHHMQKHKLNLPRSTWLLIAASSFFALNVQADPPKLILETTPVPTEILLQGDVLIDPSTGDLRVTPTDPQACQAPGQNCDDVEVQTQSFSVNNVAAVPGQTPTVDVTRGNNAVFRWNTRGAWECEGSGMPGWTGSGKLPINATAGQSVSTSNLAVGQYDTSIVCRNGPVTSSRGPVRVNVVEDNGGGGPGPAQCDAPERQPPQGWTRLTSGNLSCRYSATGGAFVGDCRVWSPGIWPVAFPGGQGNPAILTVGRQSPNEYIAVEFNSSGLGVNEIVDIRRAAASGFSPEPSIVTISTCPGDFDQASILAETGCYFNFTTLFERIRIGGAQTSRACRLQPNQTYFLNILHTDSAAGTPVNQIQSNCSPGQFCGVIYNPTQVTTE